MRIGLQCPVVIAALRQRPQDFTRQCSLTFARIVLVILRGHKLSLQTALNKVFSTLGEVVSVPTHGAFCHARRKLKPEVFTHLNRIVTEFFYRASEPEEVRRWHGHRLLSCDATFLNLPETKRTREPYSLQTNQHEGAECVQALCGVLYDVRNDLGLALTLTKRQGETSAWLQNLWATTRTGDVLILARAYAHYRLLAYARPRTRSDGPLTAWSFPRLRGFLDQRLSRTNH